MSVSEVESRVQQAMSLAFRSLERELRDRLDELHKNDEGVLVSDQFNITRLDNTIKTIRVLMDQLGYSQVIQTQVEGMAQLHNEILNEMGRMKLPQEFSQESQYAIRLLMEGSEEELRGIAEKVSAEIGQILRKSILGGVKFGDLLKQIISKLDISEAQAMTLARTALHSFNSQIRVRQFTEAGIEWFLYRGPDDPVTRLWCEHFVGTRVTPEILEQYGSYWGREDSGPMRPVDAWRGGYNCRHELVPLIGDSVNKYEIGPKR